MKKNSIDKKLRLEASTVRALSDIAVRSVAGGEISVGTCTGCRPSYCGDDCGVTRAIRGQICV
jgi:hypothetical protein